METITTFNHYRYKPEKGICWGAIIAGVFTVLSILVVLNLIGIAIGLGTIDPTEESEPLKGLGTGTVIWWGLSNLIAIFAGGYVAARVGTSLTNTHGMIQGFLTWAFYAVLSVYLVTSAAGGIISGVGKAVGKTISATAKTVGMAAMPMIEDQAKNMNFSLENAKNDFYSLLRDTEKRELQPERLESKANRAMNQAGNNLNRQQTRRGGYSDAELERIFGNASNQFEGSYKALDKQALSNILVNRTDMSKREADSTVENFVAGYETLRAKTDEFMQKAEQTAKEKGEKAAEAAATASIYLAISLILGMITAAIGGYVGVRTFREYYERNYYYSSRDL